jgi:hypothetical protein
MTDQKSTSGKRRPTRKTATAKAATKASATGTTVTAPAAEAASVEAARKMAKARPPRAKAAAKSATKSAAKPHKAAAPLFDAPLPESVTSALQAAEAMAPFAGSIPAVPPPEDMIVPAARIMEAGVQQARQTYARAQTAGETLRQAMNETAQATARGALEVNGKVMEALRAQSDAAFDAWRSALTAGSLSEAISLQASGVRQVYETAATRWKDVAETTQQWMGASVKPLQSALMNQTR